MTTEIYDYWKEDRKDYSNVILHNVTMQTSYMEDIALQNATVLADDETTEDFHYWAAFADIMQTFTDGCCTGYMIPKNLERARMKGMIDAFNSIIKGIDNGEFME